MHHHAAPAILSDQPPPPLDPRRALEVEVWISHIDRVLAANIDHNAPAARRLLARIDQTDAGQLRTGDRWSLMLLGIRASAGASAYALLRNWQAAAMQRLEAST